MCFTFSSKTHIIKFRIVSISRILRKVDNFCFFFIILLRIIILKLEELRILGMKESEVGQLSCQELLPVFLKEKYKEKR